MFMHRAAATVAALALMAAPALAKPGNHLDVHVGEGFRATLSSNHTTGYQWRLVGGPKSAKSHYEQPKVSRPGAGGRDVFDITLDKEGETDLKFEYVRPWEKQAPVRTFILHVTCTTHPSGCMVRSEAFYLHPTDSFSLEVPTDGPAGSKWQLPKDVDGGVVMMPLAATAVKKGSARFDFSAAGVGQTTITLRYGKEGAQPSRTLSLGVTVEK